MPEWWQRSPAAELQALPWLALPVIEFLEALLLPEFKVLEHGAGGSTLWLAARVVEVYSVESKAEWIEEIQGRAPENVRLVHWDQPKLPRLPARRFDLLLIDGEPVDDRALYLDAASRLVKPGGFVVLDNANRPEYQQERLSLMERAELLQSFDNNTGGTFYLVTDFYKLPEQHETGTEPAAG
jgi:predicted O-methyltransferase YrrM